MITAPTTGSSRQSRWRRGPRLPGNAPAQPWIRLDGYRVDMILPETYIAEVKPGQRVRVTIPAFGDGGRARDVIRTIVPAADQRTRSFLVKVSLPRDLPVKSGMFARVEVPLGRTAQDALIPPKR